MIYILSFLALNKLL